MHMTEKLVTDEHNDKVQFKRLEYTGYKQVMLRFSLVVKWLVILEIGKLSSIKKIKNKVQSSEKLENHMGENSFEALSKESAIGSPNQEQEDDNLCSNNESNNDAVQQNENKVKNGQSQQQITTKDWINKSFGKFQAIGSYSMDKRVVADKEIDLQNVVKVPADAQSGQLQPIINEDKSSTVENKAENNSKQVQNSLALSEYMKVVNNGELKGLQGTEFINFSDNYRLQLQVHDNDSNSKTDNNYNNQHEENQDEHTHNFDLAVVEVPTMVQMNLRS
ncbi:hypothetical protein KY289_001220 [Solanum tuberosum]|nr:hypothetical protein KY289_001220 [Solanum tuberosum]